jgi:hypothetical protein
MHIWPPDQKLIPVATVDGTDALSGLAPGSVTVAGASSEPAAPGDILIAPSGPASDTIQLRATRSGNGSGRVYTLRAGGDGSCGKQDHGDGELHGAPQPVNLRKRVTAFPAWPIPRV